MKHSGIWGGEAGFELGALEFTLKGRVLLKRPTSVAKVVGCVSSETVWED